MSGDFTQRDEPFSLFAEWLAEATASEPNDPNAMSLATVDSHGLPNVRMVLLKAWIRKVSCSTPIPKAKRAPNWQGSPRQPQFFTGKACAGRCAFGALLQV